MAVRGRAKVNFSRRKKKNNTTRKTFLSKRYNFRTIILQLETKLLSFAFFLLLVGYSKIIPRAKNTFPLEFYEFLTYV